MESRMFLLLLLAMFIFTDHSQGVPETQSSIVSVFTDATAVGEPLKTANPISTPRQHNRLCNCKSESSIVKGKGRQMMNTRCLCQQSARRSGRHGKLKTLCQREENKNLKKCSWIFKPKKGGTRKLGPSVPI